MEKQSIFHQGKGIRPFKKHPTGWFLPILTLCLIGIVLAILIYDKHLHTPEKVDYDGYAVRPHFIAKGIHYTISSHFTYQTPREGFEPVGQIQSTTDEHATEDFQANGCDIGTIIYLNPDIPYQAYAGDRRYCTEEVSEHYVRWQSNLYIHLTSYHRFSKCNADYYTKYSDQYESEIANRDIPKNAKLLGYSVFEEYDTFPTGELGNNCYEGDPCPVYQDRDDPNVLYVVYGNSYGYGKDAARIFLRYLPRFDISHVDETGALPTIPAGCP